MFTVIAIAALFCCAIGSPQTGAPPIDGRIVGGQPVDIEDYPYQISILLNGEHLCGGSIISKDFIVTAAHCNLDRQPSELQIRAGSSIRSGGQVRDVAEIHQHPNYDPDTEGADYDIAILTLVQSLQFGEKVKPVYLPDLDEIFPVGTKCTVTGWGSTEPARADPERLRGVVLPLISDEECQIAYKDTPITERMICAGYPEGMKDSCQGNF